MKTTEILNGTEVQVEWERTGDIVSRDSEYTFNEALDGYVGNQLLFIAVGVIDNDCITEITEIETVNN